MKTLVGIRTHRWGEEEERLLATLKPALGDDLVTVVQNPADGLDPPLDMVALTTEWVDARGLRKVSNWGWRCGDYAYYAMRQARPGYDHYWLIEPDVCFSSAAAPFFALFRDEPADALGLRLSSYPPDHRFSQGMPGIPLYNAIFALTRLSGRAIDRLFALRVGSAGDDVMRRNYPNDEVFVFSHVMADPDLSMKELQDIAPGWFADSEFQTDPDILVDLVADGRVPEGRLYHPVRSRRQFKSAIFGRLTARLSFLDAMAESLAEFSDEDIDEVIEETSTELRRQIKRARRSGWALRKEAEK